MAPRGHRSRWVLHTGTRVGSVLLVAVVTFAGDPAAAPDSHAPTSHQTTPQFGDERRSPLPRQVDDAAAPPMRLGPSAEGFIVVLGRGAVSGPGRQLSYRIEVEPQLRRSARAFATSVQDTLGDQRGWSRRGRSFVRDAEASTRIVLATPRTVDRLCAPLQTRGEVSCRNGDDIVINSRRWFEGADTYRSLPRYRQYLINHEVGHRLGRGHASCPAPGAPAPVMVQQTRGLQGCAPNPWP